MSRKRYHYYAGKHRETRQWGVFRVQAGDQVTEEAQPNYSVAIGPHQTKKGAHYMALACSLGGSGISARDADRLARVKTVWAELSAAHKRGECITLAVATTMATRTSRKPGI